MLFAVGYVCFHPPPLFFTEAPCVTETSSFTVKDYLLVTLLPLAGFMLVYAITHDR